MKISTELVVKQQIFMKKLFSFKSVLWVSIARKNNNQGLYLAPGGGDFGGQRRTVHSKIGDVGYGDAYFPQYFISCPCTFHHHSQVFIQDDATTTKLYGSQPYPPGSPGFS
jgi:hypothetical protein